MTNLTEDQLEFVEKAVRYYQMNGTIVRSDEYQQCQAIIKELSSLVKAREQRRAAVCDT